MKWFFALNEGGNQFENYANLLKVAVHTALKFTSLEPYFLYDGDENDLTVWLRSRAVQIIKCRSFLYDELKKVADNRGDPNIQAIGAGAFLRTEIPRITSELGLEDQYVLYTDVDVMFCSDVSELGKIKPKYFAVAPEVKINNYRQMNSGVMVMNLPALRTDDKEFRQFMTERLPDLVSDAWDQTAYKLYYKKRIFGFRWDKLPPEYNWKPYWPMNRDAKIVHFHGPKPYQKAVLTSNDTPAHLKPLLPLVSENYLRLADRWDELYHETAGSSVPVGS